MKDDKTKIAVDFHNDLLEKMDLERKKKYLSRNWLLNYLVRRWIKNGSKIVIEE